MIKLPASLESQLKKLFPRALERNKFVVDVIEDALRQEDLDEEIQAVGGTLHLYTDGGSRGNPGQSAIGCILEDPSEGKVVREHSERIGIGTNNVAEYKALIEGLKIAKRYHPNRLVCFLDSELIVRQLKGEYRVKMPALKEFNEEISELMNEFATVEFHHIPREDNFRADALVNRALDEHPSPHFENSRND
ncbi:ribonuclease HI family protein [Patescibacteria group bacterium]|nr:ribonuclease HI family protein [Patescibacteria group bacterium]MBU1123376.1 ribonuclease HI family protein [Patescibacteria group bacterium]MBU1910901.1 ribonuclease HI family protein [Patescibacteria group bacterium]